MGEVIPRMNWPNTGKIFEKYITGPTGRENLDPRKNTCQREWFRAGLRKITDLPLREYPARL
jgi:hypothetical protein